VLVTKGMTVVVMMSVGVVILVMMTFKTF